MAGQWQRKPATDGQELWAKDRTMASMNAATVALGIIQLEFQRDQALGAVESTSDTDRFRELYGELYEMHMQKGGDVAAAVATVTRAFPAAEAAPAQPAVAGDAPQYAGPGGYIIPEGFKKHAGKPITQVYSEDPTYIRNFIAVKAREEELKAAANAFLKQVDEGDPYQ